MQHESPPGIPRRTGFFVLPHAEMFAHPPAIIPRSATPPAVWPRPEVPHIIQQPRSRRINAHRGQCFKFFCVVRCPPDVQRRKRLIFPPPFQIPKPQQFPTHRVSPGIVVHHLCHHTGLLHPGPGLVPAPQRVPVLPKPAPDGPPLLLGHGCTPLSHSSAGQTVPQSRPTARALMHPDRKKRPPAAKVIQRTGWHIRSILSWFLISTIILSHFKQNNNLTLSHGRKPTQEQMQRFIHCLHDAISSQAKPGGMPLHLSIARRENPMQATAPHDAGRHTMAPDAKRFPAVPNRRRDSRSSMLHPAAPPPTLGPLAKWSAPWFNAGTQRTTHIDQKEKRCIA